MKKTLIAIDYDTEIDFNSLLTPAYIPNVSLERLILGIPCLEYEGTTFSSIRLEEFKSLFNLHPTYPAYKKGLSALKLHNNSHVNVEFVMNYCMYKVHYYSEYFITLQPLINFLYNLRNRLLDTNDYKAFMYVNRKITHYYGVLGSFLFEDLIPHIKNKTVAYSLYAFLGQFFLGELNELHFDY